MCLHFGWALPFPSDLYLKYQLTETTIGSCSLFLDHFSSTKRPWYHAEFHMHEIVFVSLNPWFPDPLEPCLVQLYRLTSPSEPHRAYESIAQPYCAVFELYLDQVCSCMHPRLRTSQFSASSLWSVIPSHLADYRSRIIQI